jgi:serine/threonine-protein kinase
MPFKDLVANWLELLRSGGRPRLEDFLLQIEQADRPALLRELLTLELEQRARRGERPAVAEYHQRLPEYGSVVEEVFGSLSTGPPVAPAVEAMATPAGARRGLTDSGMGPASAGPASPAEASFPRHAGRYEIEGKLGEGGMGEVWRARHPELQFPLAVKVLGAEYRGRAGPERRFRDEARITGQLQHPGIPPVHEVGVLPDGRPFFAMKLIKGRTLDELLKARSSPTEDLPRFLTIFEQICQTLAYAHSKGVIHRDLKPGNVMIGAFGEVQVMDWGLAKVLASRGREAPEDDAETSGIPVTRTATGTLASRPGDVVGTPAYMAPEQARGEVDQLDERCDVFGLGGILCAILTGQPPFSGKREAALQRARTGELTQTWGRLQASGAEVELLELAWRCLAPTKEDRLANAGEVAHGVAAYLASVQERLRQAERQRAVAEARAVEERKRRRLAVVLAGAVLLLVVGAGGALWLVQQQQARRDAAGQTARQLLERARGLLKKGWQEHDLARLKEAKAEANQAAAVAVSGDAPERVRQQTAAFRKEAAERLARAEKTRELLDAWLTVLAPRETRTYRSDARGLMMTMPELDPDEQYAATLQRWGLDVDHTNEREMVARLRDEPEPVLQEILAGLDTWVILRRDRKRPRAEWGRLRRLADALDGDAVRRELRRLLVGERVAPRERLVAGLTRGLLPWTRLCDLERGPDWRFLLELRGRVDPGRAPVLSVVLLARVCHQRGDEAGAEEVLRWAVSMRRNEVVLLHRLGQLLETRIPPRLAEAIECYRAVCALRPQLGAVLALALARVGRAEEGERVLRDLVRRQPLNPEVHYILGWGLYKQGKLAGAADAYQEALRLRPDYFEAHNDLGIALEEQGRVTEAVAAFKEVLRLKPNRAQAHSNLGNALHRQGRLAEAVAAHKEALRLKPDLIEAHTNLGLVLEEQGKLVEAAAAHKEALRLKPDDAVAHTSLGNALRLQGKLAEAVAAHKEALRLKPDYAVAHIHLGNALAEQGKLVEAAAAYKEALRLKPAYAEVHGNLGNVLLLQRKLVEAVAAHKEALRLKPDDAGAHINLGAALAAQGKVAEAEAAFNEALRLKPDYDAAHNNLGVALLRQGKLGEAEAAFKEALRLKPNLVEAHSNLGKALYRQGKLVEAVAACKEALRLNPNYPGAHTNLGNALRLQGKLAEAVAAHKQALRLKPDYAEAHTSLGLALAAQRKLVEAVAAHREALRFNADDAEAHTNLGNALRRQGKLVEAAAAHKEALRLKPDLFEAHAGLGAVLAEQEKLAEAVAAYKKALRLKPDSADAYTGLGVALRRQGNLVDSAAAHKEALRVKPDFAEAHSNLGAALAEQGKLVEAVTAFKEALRLKPDAAKVHANLAIVLNLQGKFHEALVSLRAAHALGSREPGWPTVGSVAQIRQFERMLELDSNLSAFLSDKRKPAGPNEQLALAFLCGRPAKRLYMVSARFYADAFAVLDDLADNVLAGYRYHAACSAAQAGCGQGQDKPQPDDEMRTRLHRQALDWLRADLAAWAKQVETGKAQARAAAFRKLTLWREDPNLAGVRDPEELKRLPQEEREAWQKLWADVAALRQRAEGK